MMKCLLLMGLIGFFRCFGPTTSLPHFTHDSMEPLVRVRRFIFHFRTFSNGTGTYVRVVMGRDTTENIHTLFYRIKWRLSGAPQSLKSQDMSWTAGNGNIPIGPVSPGQQIEAQSCYLDQFSRRELNCDDYWTPYRV